MAYSFSDVTNKIIGDGPCINGLRELKAFVQSQGQELFPAISTLFEHGYTTQLPQLKIECRNLVKRATDPNIQSSILAMGKAAAKAQEMLVMEDA